jgi:2-polyprenyl-3-methyl-5-hydroxy-6-metoxy-1,4-benzoquinol methylase
MRYLNPVQLGWLTGQAYLQRAAYYVSADKLESDLAPQRFEREVRLFRRYCPTGSVLDVGCSTGGFLHQLHARFRGSYELTGVDVVGPALAEAQRLGLATVQGSFLDLDIGSARFDAVTFWAVLEHVAEPRRFLARAAAVLKPDGYCFILVPNARSLAFRLLGSRYRYIMAEHLNYFTAATLRRLIAAEPAFRLIRLTGTHFNPVILWQDLWHPRLEVPDAERARLLRRTTALKQNPALAPLRGLYSAVERCLGWVGLTDNLVAVLQRRSA